MWSCNAFPFVSCGNKTQQIVQIKPVAPNIYKPWDTGKSSLTKLQPIPAILPKDDATPFVLYKFLFFYFNFWVTKYANTNTHTNTHKHTHTHTHIDIDTTVTLETTHTNKTIKQIATMNSLKTHIQTNSNCSNTCWIILSKINIRGTKN